MHIVIEIIQALLSIIFPLGLGVLIGVGIMMNYKDKQYEKLIIETIEDYEEYIKDLKANRIWYLSVN